MVNKASLPPRLYRYHSLAGERGDWVRQTILDGALYFASPLSYNDPFESCFDISLEGDLADYRAFADKARERGKLKLPDGAVMTDHYIRRLQSDFAHVAKTFPPRFREDAHSKIGVCSLSEVCDDILMWGHYADGHRGVCLEFEPARAPSFFESAYDVSYSDSYPAIDYFRTTPDDQARLVFLTKSQHWRYEREWRLIDVKSGPGLRQLPREALVGLVLGCAMPSDTDRLVRSWAAARILALPCRRAIKHEHEYRVSVPAP